MKIVYFDRLYSRPKKETPFDVCVLIIEVKTAELVSRYIVGACLLNHNLQ